MLAKPGRYLYWDSSVFAAYISGEPGRADVIDALWGEITSQYENRVVTAMTTVAEVAFASTEKNRRVLDPGVEQRIDRMWSHPSILQVEVSFLITKLARDLMRSLMQSTITREWRPFTPTTISGPSSCR